MRVSEQMLYVEIVAKKFVKLNEKSHATIKNGCVRVVHDVEMIFSIQHYFLDADFMTIHVAYLSGLKVFIF